MQLHGFEGLCLDGLRLLGQASWTTLGEESGHRVASGLHRLHNQYGTATLQSRTMLCQFAALLTSSPEARRLAAMQRRLARCDAVQLQRFTGRQLYLRELNEEAARQRATARDIPADISVQIMRRHGARWQALQPHRRVEYETRARAAREQAHEQLEFRKRTLREKCYAAAAEHEASVAAAGPVRLASCRLNDSEKMELDVLWREPRWAAASVMAAVPLAGWVLQPPDDTVRVLLESQPLAVAAAAVAPPWLSLLCNNRVECARYVFCVSQPGELRSKQYIFVCGTQKPVMGCFLQVEEHTQPSPSALDVGPISSAEQHWSTSLRSRRRPLCSPTRGTSALPAPCAPCRMHTIRGRTSSPTLTNG